MHTEEFRYTDGEINCIGFLAYDEAIHGERPTVLIAPDYKGITDFAEGRAIALAELGYNAFVIDLYGERGQTDDAQEAESWMVPLFIDRPRLLSRIKSALAICEHPKVNQSELAIIGYCFGGMCVYELLCSGAQLKGYVTLHGGFGKERGGLKAKCNPIQPNLSGKLLILNGHDDPVVPQSDLVRVAGEMTEAKVDWQIHDYGHTAHAFTRPGANNPERGLQYNEIAARRSWKSTVNFLEEIFSA